MSVPLIEVCIPVWNESHRIRGTLDALVAQTLKDFRVRVYDNASTDNTVEICESYADQLDIEVFARTCNAGQTFNINRCYKGAQSELVTLLSGNDIPAPNYLEVLAADLQADADLGSAYAPAIYVDGDGSPISPQPSNWDFFSLTHDDPVHRACESIKKYSQASNFFCVYRRSTLDRMQDQPYCYGGDHIFAAESALYGKVACNQSSSVLRSIPPGTGSKGQRLVHLMQLFSLDVQRGVPRNSRLAAFENLTPHIDMFHGLLNMFRLADLEHADRGRLVQTGTKTFMQRFPTGIEEDIKRLPAILEKIQYDAEAKNTISRFFIFQILKKVDEALFVAQDYKLMELRNNIRAIFDYSSFRI